MAGCAVSLFWAIGSIVYLILLSWISRRAGAYGDSVMYLGMGLLLIAYVVGKAPFVPWMGYTRWGKLDVGDEESAGAGVLLAVAVVLILVGIGTALHQRFPEFP
jgi:hypothetical protein